VVVPAEVKEWAAVAQVEAEAWVGEEWAAAVPAQDPAANVSTLNAAKELHTR